MSIRITVCNYINIEYKLEILAVMDVSSDVKSIDSSDYDMWNENDVAGNIASPSTSMGNKSGKILA